MRFRKRMLKDLDQDIRDHIEREMQDNIERGMPPEEARYAALRKFGNVRRVREDTRSVWSFIWIEQLFQDVRYGLRLLRRNPGFAATAILTLALGIGATTAIFSLVDGVVLKPLPYPTADRLVWVASVFASNGHGGVASYPDFLDWRARNHVFDGMAAYRTSDFTLIGSREPLHVQGAVVSAQLFSLLGASPMLGRGFRPEEDNPAAAGGTNPVILSYGLWQREFGSDASVLGRTIELGDQPFTVIGVMPQAFQFPIQADSVALWTTIGVDARGGANAMTAQRGAHYLDVDGLLKPGIKIEQAQAEMAAIAGTLNKEHPENKPRTVRIMPELERLVGPVRTPLLVLLGAVGFVLLIVCANIANLLLARATGRYKEMALRAALGASRRRAVCQLLAESTSLGLLGGALGIAFGLASLRLLVRLIPAEVPRLDAVGLDARLLVFSLLISLMAGILFGLASATRVSKINLTDSLKASGSGSASKGQDRGRLRDVLVVSEVSLAVVLLAGAGLLIQSFLRLTRVNPGFDPHQVLTFQLDSPAGLPDAQLPAFFAELVKRLDALPGITSASAVASLPLTGDNISSGFEVEGEPTPQGSRPTADFNAVEPNYFHTLGIALLAGRDFTEHDEMKTPPVVIINRTLAERFFPNQNPIGKRVRPGIANGYYGSGEPPMREIVGVIRDVKQGGLESEVAPEMYAPLAQSPFGTMLVVLRTANDPLSDVAAARGQVASLDKNSPIYHVETLDQYLAQSVAEPRLSTLLLSVFAGLAVLLACLGVYGVMSYIVGRRTHEIGIRMALGAQRSDVLRMVFGHGLRPVLAGVMIGIAGAAGLTRLLASLLYGVKPGDPLTFVAVSLVLTGVALVACWIPARRATRVDPMVALRYE